MSKISGLEFIRTRLGTERVSLQSTLFYGRQHGQQPTSADLERLGALTLTISECDRLLWDLRQLHLNCEHGLAGTVPEFYEGTDMEGDTAPYDCYREMGYMFMKYGQVWVGALSPLLHQLSDGLPEACRAAHDRLLNSQVPFMVFEPDTQEGRPLSQAELLKRGQAMMLDAMERTMFTQTYASDMAQVAQLIDTRGDLGQLLALLGPLPEPPF